MGVRVPPRQLVSWGLRPHGPAGLPPGLCRGSQSDGLRGRMGFAHCIRPPPLGAHWGCRPGLLAAPAWIVSGGHAPVIQWPERRAFNSENRVRFPVGAFFVDIYSRTVRVRPCRHHGGPPSQPSMTLPTTSRKPAVTKRIARCVTMSRMCSGSVGSLTSDRLLDTPLAGASG